jgi:hypothetical protein
MAGFIAQAISDRCIPIRLLRRSREESIQRFRKRDAEAETLSIREILKAWGQQNGLANQLRGARPKIPNELDDRQADICEPLLAIADIAGGHWPQRCRESLISTLLWWRG